MARKFLSFLGTGNYGECIYKCTNENIKTRFIQRALVEDLCKDWTDEDEVVIFVTQKSKKTNWESGEKEIEKRIKLNDQETLIKKEKQWFYGLNEELKQLSNYNFKITEKVINEGKNIEEIWEIFKCMMQQIYEGDEVIFDITHSFRSIPMLALVVLNYAKVVKNINIIGIYYGAYEAKDEEGVAPVFDLKEFDRLLEWAYAVNSFVKFGDSRQILELVNREKKYDCKYREVANFASRLNDFTSSITTCRGTENKDKKKSVQRAYNEMENELNIVREKNNMPHLRELLSLVEKRTESFKHTDNLSTGIAFVQWCIDNKLVQQGYTSLDETIKTYICRLNGLEETNFENREDIAAKACIVFAKSKNEWKVKDNYRETIEKIITTTPKELFDLAQKIRDARNDINHFGYRNGAKSYDALERDLKESFNKFLNIISKINMGEA